MPSPFRFMPSLGGILDEERRLQESGGFPIPQPQLGMRNQMMNNFQSPIPQMPIQPMINPIQNQPQESLGNLPMNRPQNMNRPQKRPINRPSLGGMRNPNRFGMGNSY